jgi:hypothetical protein
VMMLAGFNWHRILANSGFVGTRHLHISDNIIVI